MQLSNLGRWIMPILLWWHLAFIGASIAYWLWRRPPLPYRLQGRHFAYRCLGGAGYGLAYPFLVLVRHLRLTPKILTLSGMVLASIAAIAVSQRCYAAATVLLFWSGFCDLLDGELAREQHSCSPQGAFLDSYCDRVGEMMLFLGICHSCLIPQLPTLSFIAISSSFLVSYARARGEDLGIICPNGGFERPARIVTMLGGLTLCALWGHAEHVLPATTLIVAVGAGITAASRFSRIYSMLASNAATSSPRPSFKGQKSLPLASDHAHLHRHFL